MEPQTLTFWEIFWDIIEKVANSTGIVSSIISVATLFIASSTKRAIAAHDEQKEYELNIDENINELKAIYTGIDTDDIYNKKVLQNIIKEIDNLKIYYPNVIKPNIRDIKKLEKYASSAIDNIHNDKNHNKGKVTRQLNIVINELKKGKQLL